MKKYSKVLSVVLLSSLLFGCVEKYETEKVTATVIEKDYDAPKTKYKTVKKNGKNVRKKTKTKAEYDVEIQYKDVVAEFDDKGLYNSVKKGQKIEVIYKQGFNKDGKLVVENLELID